MKKSERTAVWHEQPKWVAMIVIVSLAVAYVSLLQALNTGNLWLYTLTLIAFYIAVDRVVHAFETWKKVRTNHV